MWRTDFRLGEIVNVLVFYNISFSWLFSLNGLEFYFLSRDIENDLYGLKATFVRVKEERKSDLQNNPSLDQNKGESDPTLLMEIVDRC